MRLLLLAVVAMFLAQSEGSHAAATEEALLIVDGAQNLSRSPRSAVARQTSYTMDLEVQ